MKLRPVDFASEGLFLCGTAHAPKFIGETISQANAVAGRAASILSRKKMPVGGQIAWVDPDKCISCMTCVHVCPYMAPQINDEQQGRGAGGHLHGLRQLHGGVSGQGHHAAAFRRRPDPGRGEQPAGRGAEKRSAGAGLSGTGRRGPAALATELKVNDIMDREPLILAFCCHYCAYAAADLAGSMRLQYPQQRPRAAAALHGQDRGQLPPGGLRARRGRRDRGRLPGRRLPFPRRQPARPAAGRARQALLAEIGLEPERLEMFNLSSAEGAAVRGNRDDHDRRLKRLGNSPLRPDPNASNKTFKK